jgi:putative SOS response-associated peptidase YedK
MREVEESGHTTIHGNLVLAKSVDEQDRFVNTVVRGETVAEKPSFRSAFKSRRYIIPASGFYEWKTESGIKQPWYMTLRSGEPMAFAGIWGNMATRRC